MLFVTWLQKTQNYAFVTLFVGRIISPNSQVQGKVTDLIFNGRHASQMKKKTYGMRYLYVGVVKIS